MGAFLLPLSAVASSIQPYPNATLDLEINEQRTSHPIISSAMKKVNGVVLADSEQWLDGYLSRKLYLLPSGKSSFEAYEFFTRQFEEQGVEPLFVCDRFNCGDSNFWANNIFDIARLYGLNKEQAYYLGRKSENGKDIYYLTYTVKRGNKREYALVDVFTAGQKVKQETVELSFLKIPEITQGKLYGEIKNTLRKSGPVLVNITVPLPEDLQTVKDLERQLQSLEDRLKESLSREGIRMDQVWFQTVLVPGGKKVVQIIPLL